MAIKTPEQVFEEFKEAIVEVTRHCARVAKSKEEAAQLTAFGILNIIDGTSASFSHSMELFAVANDDESKKDIQEYGGDWLEEDVVLTEGPYLHDFISIDCFPPEFYPTLLARYSVLALELPCTHDKTSGEHIVWMLEQLAKDEEQSVTKKHRWLGFIQGVLIANGVTSVDAERELTRGIFNGA